MENSWTPEQLEAIEERGCNLLVAAAAGSGKTAVLVERVIRKITDKQNPADIDRLLVVTFTNAAATEMREKIGDALAKALKDNPSSANLQRQMILLDRASIMTLHSFCLEVVRSHFHILGLDPAFRVADETESLLLKLDALEELFEGKYDGEADGGMFFKLVDCYGGGRGDDALKDVILETHRFAQSRPWPSQWLAAQAEAYNIGSGASACLSSTPWAIVLLKSAAAEMQGLAALLRRAAAAASRVQGMEQYRGILENDLAGVNRLYELFLAVLEQAELCRKQSTAGAGSAAGLDCGTGISPCTQQDAAGRPNGNISRQTSLSPGNNIPGRRDDIHAATDLPHACRPPESNSGLISTCCGDAAGCANDPHPGFPCAGNKDACWNLLNEALSSFEPARLPRSGKNVDMKVLEEIKKARSIAKEKIRKISEGSFIKASEVINDLKELYPLLKCLADMVNEFDEIYTRKKRDKGILDFNDLEHCCLKILINDGIPTKAAEELRERYEEILVDECQDSNMVQELIIETISGNRAGRHNIFMVGDVKQSIYRFRQAMPELFMSKYLSYPRQKGHDNRVIQLYKNFRCRSAVIDGVNYIFRQIMSEMVGELDYTAEEFLRPGAEYGSPPQNSIVGGPVEVHLVDVAPNEDNNPESSAVPEGDDVPGSSAASVTGDTNGASGMNGTSPANDISNGEETGSEEEPIDNIQAEARVVGKRIKEIVGVKEDANGNSIVFHVYDKNLKNYRPVKYRDIVILMRATKNRADVFADELSALGIPVYADTDMGYFRTVEVETMISLLKIIDNPRQDIPMLAVLRSPICGFDTDDLADIRLADRSATIYEALKKFASGEGKETHCSADGTAPCVGKGGEARDVRRKAAEFLERLEKWRDAAQYMPTDELVWKLLNETGYYSYVGILPGGQGRQANLRILFERAGQYEKTSYKGLFNFINFINRMRSGGGDMGSARLLGENDNVVRIMSIHKSKGLEFPIVIVAGCGKKFNMLDLNGGVLLHHELGFGTDLVDPGRRTITPTFPKFAIRQKLRLETLSEEMRILYVALTRAREKLIIAGIIKDIEKTGAGWCAVADSPGETLPCHDMAQASTYLDWIGPALVRHRSAAQVRKAAGFPEDAGWIADDASTWDIKIYGIKEATDIKGDISTASENFKNWLAGIEDSPKVPAAPGFAPDSDAASSGAAAPGSESSPCGRENAVVSPCGRENAGGSPCGREGAGVSPSGREGAGSGDNAVINGTGRIIECLEWKYPYAALTSIPAKISVTELKRRFSQDEQEGGTVLPFLQSLVARPSFMDRGEELSAAGKGTIMHFVMQRLDLKKLYLSWKAGEEGHSARSMEKEVKEQLASLVKAEHLTAAEAETVDAEKIAAFFGTHVGRRMLAAPVVYREMAFSVEVRCTDIYTDLPKEIYGSETMLLQGVIDCWFETEEGTVLLDYKTDHVPPGGPGIIRERYRVQMDCYARALEQLTGKKAGEKYLYLFSSGELLEC